MTCILQTSTHAAQGRAVSMGRIPTLDGWRGLAILLVLIGHFSPPDMTGFRSLGHHGVAIFFVLSGFLITSLLLREQERTGTVNLQRFYFRRAFRLMPCAWLYLAVVIFITAGMTTRPFAWSEIAGCIFFFRNYLDLGSAHIVTGHFWSLSIEEQFYLLWPSLLLLGRRRALWIAIAGGTLVAAWRLQHWTALSHGPIMDSTLTQYRADALLCGCAMALAMPALKPYLRAWMAIPLLTALAACLYQGATLISLHESIVIALLLGITSHCAIFRGLDWKPLAFIGTISYSLYVWQQPFWLFATHKAHVTLPAIAGLTLVSVSSYFLIEKPLIAYGSRLRVGDRPALQHGADRGRLRAEHEAQVVEA